MTVNELMIWLKNIDLNLTIYIGFEGTIVPAVNIVSTDEYPDGTKIVTIDDGYDINTPDYLKGN